MKITSAYATVLINKSKIITVYINFFEKKKKN